MVGKLIYNLNSKFYVVYVTADNIIFQKLIVDNFDVPSNSYIYQCEKNQFSLNQAMDIIESMDPVTFSEYLKKYQNTICGRHPIGVLLNVSRNKFSFN